MVLSKIPDLSNFVLLNEINRDFINFSYPVIINLDKYVKVKQLYLSNKSYEINSDFYLIDDVWNFCFCAI
jgi:flagellar assembly factor FliW